MKAPTTLISVITIIYARVFGTLLWPHNTRIVVNS